MVYKNSATVFVTDGDSHLAGTIYAVTGYSEGVMYQLDALIKTNLNLLIKCRNDAIDGHTIAQMDTQATTTIDTGTYPARITNKVLILDGGGNDIVGGASVATTYSRFTTYLANHVAGKGYSAVIELLPYPRYNTGTSTDWTTEMFQYADMVTTNAATIAASIAPTVFRIADPRTLTQFDAAADTSNTTYYNADRLHLTSTGNALIAQLLYDTLNAAPSLLI